MAPEIVKSKLGNRPAPVVAAPTHAYVTFLAGAGDYFKGVVGLAKGLRKVGAAYPLVVAVLPDVPAAHRRVLVEQGCLVREIEPVFPPAGGSRYVRNYFVVNYCKLRLWEFEEYDKMIYMDADIQVFDNIDHLFDLPSGYFYGVVDCLCEIYSKPCPEKLRWPEELGPQPSYYLNGGMFVFEPKITTCRDLLATLELTPPTPFAEQDFLNMFFRDKMKPLPYIYNLLVAMLWRHPEAVNLEKAKVVHYCMAGSKPWRYTGEGEHMDRADIKMLVSKWWEIYNDVSLDFNPVYAQSSPLIFDPVIGDAPEGKKLASALSGAEVVVRYRSASSAAYLNMFFRDKMKPLPYIYNLLVAMLWRHPEAVNLEKAKVVHYCMAGSKPWRYTGEGEHMDRADIKMLVSKWWEIYNDVSLDFNPVYAQSSPLIFDPVIGDAPEGKKLASALSGAEVVVRYRSASSAA